MARLDQVRVVVDANVIVSAAFGGTPLRALVRAFRYQVITSPSIKQELLSLPEQLAHRLSQDRMIKMKRWLKILLYKTELRTPKKEVSLCRDPKDDAYLSLCLEANADCLITGDKDLLSLSKEALATIGLDHLSILTPRKFLNF